MTSTPRPSSALRLASWLVALLLLVLTVPVAPAAAQEPPASLPPSASVGGVVLGGTLAADEERDPDGDAVLTLGTTLDGLVVNGARNGFAPGEVAAFRLALPAAAGTTGLTVHLVTEMGDGLEALAGTGAWALDPAWDTITGLILAPPVGQHALRVYRGPTLVASAPIASWDVPRVVGAVTDPQGVLADAADQVSAALGRFADTTDGQLWLAVLDSTGDIGAADYAARLWSVNEDHMWPGDALAVITTSDGQVAVQVGSDLGFYVTPDEVDGVVVEAEQPVIEGRFPDAVDVIADALVAAFDAPPPPPGATPTPRPSPTPETVRTPDFVGLTRAEAQALAREQDLRLRILFEQTDSAPPGTVIAQEPAAGRPVEILGRVTITVAQAPALVTVPDVVGEREDDAVDTLLDAGLQPGTRTSRTSANVSRGRIISTNPRAGVVVQPGSTIDYVVSRGPAASPSPTPRPTATPRIVTVPDLRGLPEADALTELGSVGLRAGERTRAFHSTIDEGEVIRTDPPAGVRVSRGTAVDYVVSRGPRPEPTATPRPTATPGVVTVPDLRGVPEADALTELGSVGLRAGERTRAFHSRIGAGEVIRTDPAAGVRVRQGTAVDYVVSRGPRPTPTPTPRPTATPRPTPTATPRPTPTAVPRVTVPDLRGLPEADALTELGSVGLRAGERTRAFHSRIDAGSVIRTDPAAGERVRQGTAVDYVVSRGPRPTPTPRPTPEPTPAPTATPEPTVAPTPEPTEAPTGDLLERIRAAGRIVVNVDTSDAPWSRRSAEGTYHGFEVDIANRLASSLGVDVEFTTYPFEQVVTGDWGGRFDIAMQHLAITDPRRTVLDFSAPYAYEPAQLVVSSTSGIGSIEELAGAIVCAARGSVADQWVSATLQLTDPPLPPTTAPDGLEVRGTTTDASCIDAVASGSDGVVAGLVGADDVARAIEDGAAIVPLGDPVFHAPIGIAFDRSGPDPASLEAELGAALEALRADGTLSQRSVTRFGGLDLSQVPDGAPPATPAPGDSPAFGVDDTLVERFPTQVGDTILTPLFLDGADLDLLLRPSNTSVSRTLRPFLALGEGTDQGIAALGLAMAPVVSGDGSATLTAARMEGTSAAALGQALTPLFGNQLRSDAQTAEVELGGKDVTRTSSGAYSEGDLALWVYTRSGVAWFVWGTEPLVEDILAALP